MAKKLTIRAARVSAGYTQETKNGRAPFNRPVLLAWSKVTGFEVDDFILPEVSTQRQTEEVE